MSERRAVNPLVDQFRKGGVPRDLRLMAAQGALPLKPADLMELLHHLLRDADAEIRATATATLTAMPADEMLPILKDRETPPAVLAWVFAAREERELREAVLQNTSLAGRGHRGPGGAPAGGAGRAGGHQPGRGCCAARRCWRRSRATRTSTTTSAAACASCARPSTSASAGPAAPPRRRPPAPAAAGAAPRRTRRRSARGGPLEDRGGGRGPLPRPTRSAARRRR